jgi:predicted enzyme related to lactoylglutathione lyase
MANVGFFQIPADDIHRAKNFYQSLLGWKIEPDTTLENKSLQWQNIITGEAKEGTMNKGGLFKRYIPGQIMNFVIVDDFDHVYDNVKKLGGTIVMPKNDIKTVGLVAVIQDTEGNVIGLLKPAGSRS